MTVTASALLYQDPRLHRQGHNAETKRLIPPFTGLNMDVDKTLTKIQCAKMKNTNNQKIYQQRRHFSQDSPRTHQCLSLPLTLYLLWDFIPPFLYYTHYSN